MNTIEINFRTFVERHFKRLAAVAGRVTLRLPPSSREEVFASSLLAAWERRDSFDPERGDGAIEGRLSLWFAEIVKLEKRKFFRREMPAGRAAALERLTSDSDPAAEVEAADVIEHLELSPAKQAAVTAFMNGDSLRMVATATGLNRGELRALKKRLKFELRTEPKTPASPRRALPDSEDAELAPIDRQLAKLTNLEFPPKTGKECTPCIQCTWWEGFKPANRRSVRAKVVSVEVGEAQAAIYERKVFISATVSSGGEFGESATVRAT